MRFRGSCRIAVDQRQSRGRLADTLPEGHRAADDHEEIVGMRPLIGHDELEMHPEELPTEPVVMFRADDLAEPDGDDSRVPPGRLRRRSRGRRWGRTGRNSSRPCGTGSRSSRWTAPWPAAADCRESPGRALWKPTMGILPPSVSRTTRGPWLPSSGSSFSARARISEPRNEPELWPTSTISCASVDCGDLDQMLRETVDPGVPVRPVAVGKLPGEDRVGHQIEQIGVFFGVFQQRAEDGDEHRSSAAAHQKPVYSERLQPPARIARRCGRPDRTVEQQKMRPADEGGKAPMRLPEPAHGAGEH
jgi:hypothetical protein